MPKLTAQTREITLPESGIKCHIGITYGDKIAIQKTLLSGSSVSLNEEQRAKAAEVRAAEKSGDKETAEKLKAELGEAIAAGGKIGIDQLIEHDQALLLHGLKKWDATGEDDQPLEINKDTVSLLSPTDGEFLKKEIEKDEKGDLTDEAKKK